MAGLFYRDLKDERADKAQQERLLAALNAWEPALRRDDNTQWIIRGNHGAIYACGNGSSWSAFVACRSKVAWTWAKKRLAFMTVPQDGDEEGVFRLDRLPTPEEAETIRDIVGIRKRRDESEETLQRLRSRLERINAPAKRPVFASPASAEPSEAVR